MEDSLTKCIFDDKIIFYFSARMKETKNDILNKLTRRLEHITNFRVNSSQFESQPFQVRLVLIQHKSHRVGLFKCLDILSVDIKILLTCIIISTLGRELRGQW